MKTDRARYIVSNALLLAVLAFLAACSRENAIVGSWQCGEGFFVFQKDGVCTLYGPSTKKLTGRFTVLSRDKLRIQINDGSAPRIVLISIKGNEMTLTDQTVPLKFHKVDSFQWPRETEEEEIRRHELERERAR